MKIFDAITELKRKERILINNHGDKFQRYSDTQIFVTYNKERIIQEGSSSVGGTIFNDEFIKKYIDDSFDVLEQWYDTKSFKYPILCWVTCGDWQFSKKLVCFKSRSGNMFMTGFGESYILSIHTKITPLTDDEIDSFKRGVLV